MQEVTRAGGQAIGHVRAWDLPTRVFHWLLVALVISAWVSFRYSENFGDHLLKWHRWNGLAILTLLVWRLLWGVAGPRHVRFAHFVRGGDPAIAYARDLFALRPPKYLGHNPLGALMVVALLAALIAQASLGLFTVEHNDLTAGPLYRLVSEATTKWASRWHDWLFHYLLLPLIAIHITANVLYGLVLKEPLIGAMITGRKPARVYVDGDAAQSGGHVWRALALLLVSAILVLGTIRFLAGRLI